MRHTFAVAIVIGGATLAGLGVVSPAAAAPASEIRYAAGISKSGVQFALEVPTAAKRGKTYKVRMSANYMSDEDTAGGVVCEYYTAVKYPGKDETVTSIGTSYPFRGGPGYGVRKSLQFKKAAKVTYVVICTLLRDPAKADAVMFKTVTRIK